VRSLVEFSSRPVCQDDVEHPADKDSPLPAVQAEEVDRGRWVLSARALPT
jgi:hypothetical protein